MIRQAPGERAYHIFYQIMSGHNKDLCCESYAAASARGSFIVATCATAKLLLDKTPRDYWYVNQAETVIAGVDDKEEFQMSDASFSQCALLVEVEWGHVAGSIHNPQLFRR